MSSSPAKGSAAQLCITGVGMLTSLGQTGQSCAALRAGLRHVSLWENYMAKGPDEQFDPPEPIQVGLAALPMEAEHQWDRLVDLSLPAIEEAVLHAGLGRAVIGRSLFSACLPVAPDQDADAELGKYYLDGITDEGAIPPAKQSRVYYQGHAAGAVALSEAAKALRENTAELCILGGVDSVLDGQRLDQLDRDYRLKTARSPNGYIPGEAAAFCVIERADRAKKRGAKPLAYVNGVEVAREPHPFKDTEPSTAQGMCQAIREAVAQASSQGESAQPSGWVLSDFNGERHRAWEWGLALPRLNALLGENLVHWHPAECLGDVGAASTAMLLAVATRAYEAGFAPRPTALVLTASDRDTRGAILLSGPEKKK